MRAVARGLLGVSLLLASPASADHYVPDDTWQPAWPMASGQLSGVDVAHAGGKTLVYVTQRENPAAPQVLILDAATGEQATSFEGEGWIAPGGAHGIKVEEAVPGAPPLVPADDFPNLRVWVDDFTNHTLTAFSGNGAKLLQIGTPGIAGNGTGAGLQFGNLADTAIDNSQPDASAIYVADGDGGSANRVVKLTVTNNPFSWHFNWATDHIYRNPHSIAHHPRTGLLLLADREQNKTTLLRASDGADLGEFDCGLKYGPAGADAVPFGVRTLHLDGRDLGFVAIMDNPQDHRNQKIAVLDLSQLSAEAGANSPCNVLQTLEIDPQKLSGPHLMGVDRKTGDLYAALVADVPKSTVLRWTWQR